MIKIRIAIAQINTTVGDLLGNTEKILFCIDEAVAKKVDLIVFPELSITGYPPEDLLLKPQFIDGNLRYLNKITNHTEGIIAVVGFADGVKGIIYNSAAVMHDKKILYKYHKKHLPNYGVFDEKRYFIPGAENIIFKAQQFSFSINICEDIWVSEDAAEKSALKSSDFLVNISASPYSLEKIKERASVLKKKAQRFNASIVYCNLVGGQDELIFDGRSLVFDKMGKIIVQAKAFEEDLLIFDMVLASKKTPKKNKNTALVKLHYEIRQKKDAFSSVKARDMSKVEEVYSALVLGIQDYVRKNGFKKVALGLSGGIDSALVACIAVDALGKANVLAISMPSKYSSKGTKEDSEKIAKNLGIRFAKIPIADIFSSYLDILGAHFSGMQSDITEENLQARIRGNILMAFSNKFGYLILATGNKSETSVGYCTLYGDMAGGFAVIKDIPKKLVYELSRYVNKRKKREIIPESVFERPPSAELRPDQKDQDTLPPYAILDEIIDLYIEKNKSFGEISKKIGQKDIVRKVISMIDMNEYKRRQAPPGIKVTPKAFGKDRRMPITNKFRPF